MSEQDTLGRPQSSAICRLVEARVQSLVANDRQSVAHRFDHVARVLRNAEMLARSYPEADSEILTLAVLLHDIDQPFDDKANHVAYSAKAAETILAELSYPADRIRRVVQVIREHSTETIDVSKPTSIEARILFDADKIDGVGAFGILRVFALSQQMGRPIPESIAWYRRKIDTALAHLQTPQGRDIVLRRLPLVESFLADLEESLGQQARG
ncbi:MAG: HD domain-containing protein [Bradyrhizobium sp.]